VAVGHLCEHRAAGLAGVTNSVRDGRAAIVTIG
jgi:hypothetical protein